MSGVYIGIVSLPCSAGGVGTDSAVHPRPAAGRGVQPAGPRPLRLAGSAPLSPQLSIRSNLHPGVKGNLTSHIQEGARRNATGFCPTAALHLGQNSTERAFQSQPWPKT